MRAIRVETVVDEAAARAIPALRPLLGERVEITAQKTERGKSSARGRGLTVDELLAERLTPPPGVGPVSLEDMERAIEKGAAGGVD